MGAQGPYVPEQAAAAPIDPGVRLGHVHLRTADIDRIRAFYVDVLGFDVVAEIRDVPGWGTTGDALFLSAGGYHHHLGGNTWNSLGAAPPPPGSAALERATIVLPDAGERDRLVARVADTGQDPEQRADGVVVRDPAGNALVLAA
jgi:catechol 2,3-dioxygenase